jgi:pimeloyl-ACP methyl ester carboxylesterase
MSRSRGFLGGWVAMELAVAHRDRVGKLVLVDPIGVQTKDAEILNPMMFAPAEALRANYHDAAPFLAAAASASADQRTAQAVNVAAATRYTSQGLFDADLPRRLTTVGVPVFVLFGESERVVPRSSAEAIVEAVSGPAGLKIIHEAGHRPQLEQPAK